MKYLGLTDHLQEKKQEHGNPFDWVYFIFSTESMARSWKEEMLTEPSYKSGAQEDGWRYGYIYTITSTTRQ